MDYPTINHKFHRYLIGAEKFEKDWRKRNERNFDFYDGNQWEPDEIETLEKRGQQPTVLNMVRPMVDLLLSIETEKRSDIQVVGRNPEDLEPGDILTALLKQSRDQSVAEYFESMGFRDGIKGGRGWLFIDLGRKKKTDSSDSDSDSEPDQVYLRHVPWEEVYIDPYHRLPDGTDARFIIRKVWTDRDMLKKRYPSQADKIESVFNEDYRGVEYEAQKDSPDRAAYRYYDPLSGRVMTCHCWYKDASGRVRFVIFAENIFLKGDPEDDQKNETPNGIDAYPLVPFTCFTNRKGEPQGLIDLIRDPQIQINKLNSKYLWNLSCNRLMVETNALATSDNSIEEAQLEWNRPNGVIMLAEGGLNRIRAEDNLRELPYLDNHLQLLLAIMQRTTGINDSITGIGGQNERSAVQQQNRILQGASMQTQLLENLHFTKLAAARVMLKLIAKHYKKGVAVRILQPNGGYDFKYLNQPVTDEEGKIVETLNQIDDVLRYDVVLTRVAPFSTMRERIMQMISEVAKSGFLPPEIVSQIILEYLDIPHKRELMQKAEQILGGQRAAAEQAQQMQIAQMASGAPASG